jgi:hypothetical protein
MTYAQVCDTVMQKLIDNAATIGVAADSIIEGGREALAPSINVFIDPDIDLDGNVATVAGFLTTRIELVCLAVDQQGEDLARRTAFAICAKALLAVLEIPAVDKLLNIGFAETNSDATACVATLSTKTELG